MEHKITMTVELTMEAPTTKTQEEIEGAAYWTVQVYLDEAANQAFESNEIKLKDFDIEIN